jgi:hypothetical protein
VSDTIHYRAAGHWEGAATVRHGGASFEVIVDLHVVTAAIDDVETRGWTATAVGLPLDLLGDVELTLRPGTTVTATVVSTGRLSGDGDPLAA